MKNSLVRNKSRIQISNFHSEKNQIALPKILDSKPQNIRRKGLVNFRASYSGIAMESTRSSGNMKAQKVKAASNENVSPLQMDDQIGRFLQSVTMIPRVQPFAENIDASSPLRRYFFDGSPLSGEVVTASDAFTSPTFGSSKYSSAAGSGSSGSLGPRGRLSLSPLSSVENLDMAQLRSPPMYGTPVKVDEVVLVMDDILVRSIPGGKNGRSSSCSSGRDSASSSSSWSSSPPWVKSGSQFEHGKEEMHPTGPTMKSGNEAQMRNSPLSAGSGVYNSNSRTVYQSHAATEPVVTTSQPATPVKLVPGRTLLAPVNTNPNTSREWSPLDDGIKVVLLNASDRAPSREEVDSSISRLLHVLHQGRTGNRRLPVFVTLGEGHDPVIDKKPSQ